MSVDTIIDRNLPFFPSYDAKINGHIIIWWFNRDFSQSRYNYKNTPSGSNACTIITALMAAQCHYNNITISAMYNYHLEPSVIYAFAISILEGNDIHDNLRKSGNLENINLTVPEAIQSAGRQLQHITEWKSVLYLADLGETLYIHFKQHLNEWYGTSMYKHHPDLYMILIADQRSVLFIIEDRTDMVSICDSHQHLEYGAMIAQAPRRKLKSLCEWVAQMFCSCFNSHPDCYELSFLYFRKSRWRHNSSRSSSRPPSSKSNKSRNF